MTEKIKRQARYFLPAITFIAIVFAATVLWNDGTATLLHAEDGPGANKVAAPTITMIGSESGIGAKVVSLSCETFGAVIHYTTDGSDPTYASKIFYGAIGLASNGTTTVKAVAYKDGFEASDVVVSPEYTVNIVGVIPAGHPRVYFQQKDAEEIYAKRLIPSGTFAVDYASNGFTNTWAKIIENSGAYTASTVTATGTNDNLQKAIEANAVMYALDREAYSANGEKAAALTVAYAQSSRTNNGPRPTDSIMITLAQAYDWCYDLFTADQLTIIRNKIIALAEAGEYGFLKWTGSSFTGHGSEQQFLHAHLLAGIAIYDEDPRMFDFVYNRIITDFVPSRYEMYKSANTGQGDSYSGRYSNDLRAVFLLKGIGQPNPFTVDQAEVLKYYSIYQRRPDGAGMRSGDSYWPYTYGYNFYWIYDRTLHWMAATLWDDPVLQDEANRCLYSLQGSGLEAVTDLLLRNQDAGKNNTDPNGAAKVAELPLTRYFGGILPSMIARTGWFDPNVAYMSNMNSTADIVIADMRMPNYYPGNHQHIDTGSFQLYYKGWLAVDSGWYDDYETEHDMNYEKRSIAHNTITVFDPNEKFYYYGSELVNDGGQRTPNNMREPDSLDDLLNPANKYKVSEVIGYDFGGGGNPEIEPLYSYLAGDMSLAYNEKVSSHKRSMVFLHLGGDVPGALIVYDSIASSDANFKKSWLLHSEEEPLVADARTVIERNDRIGTGAMTAYSGKLVNDTLLPADPVITKIGGPGNEFVVNGKNYPPRSGSYNPLTHNDTAGQWRIEVSPETPNKSDSFLNVMQVMDVSFDEPFETELTEPAKGEIVGAKISGWEVYFSKSGELISHEIIVTAGDGTDHILLSGLASGKWEVNGASVTVREEAGTIYIEATPGETYIITAAEGVSRIPSITSVRLSGSLLVQNKITGSIILEGYNFLGGSLSFISADDIETKATLISITDTEIVGAIPAGMTAGSYRIRVTAGSSYGQYNETITVGDGTAGIADPNNLIKNPSFETAALGQSTPNYWTSTRGLGKVTFTSDRVTDGVVAAIMTERDVPSNNERNGFTQDIKEALLASGPGRYELSGWMGLTGVDIREGTWHTESAVIAIVLNGNDRYNFYNPLKAYKSWGDQGPRLLIEDTGWHYLSNIIDLTWDTLDSAEIEIRTERQYASGLYADGISLVKVKAGIDAIVPSGRFEEGLLGVNSTLTIYGEQFDSNASIALIPHLGEEAQIIGEITIAAENVSVSPDGSLITVTLPSGLGKGSYRVRITSNGVDSISEYIMVVFGEIETDPAELLLNPGFETGDASFWQSNGGVVTASSEYAHSGLFSAKAEASADWQGPGQDIIRILETYGKGLYEASAWVMTTTAQANGLQLTLAITPAGGAANYIGKGSGPLAANEWTQIVTEYDLSNENGYSQALIKTEDIVGVFYSDNFSFKRAPHIIYGVTGTEPGELITITGFNFSDQSRVFFVPVNGGEETEAEIAGVTSAEITAVIPVTLTANGEYVLRVVIGGNLIAESEPIKISGGEEPRLPEIFASVDFYSGNGNGQSNIDFGIRSANGKGYSVYIVEAGGRVENEIPLSEYRTADANFNSKGAHVKKLTNGVVYYAYIVYSSGGVYETSNIVTLNPNK